MKKASVKNRAFGRGKTAIGRGNAVKNVKQKVVNLGGTHANL